MSKESTMKKHKKKLVRIEHVNRKRFNKVLKRKRKFNDRVNQVAQLFMNKDKKLIFSCAKQKAIQLLAS